MKKIISLIAGIALSSASGVSLAENTTQIPGYTIHHNALTTDSLPPQVAKTYNIQRSKNRGMLNVSVIKDEANTTGQPVKATVKASATNLTGQSRAINLREIREGEAIYYIGDFRVANQETLNFVLEVTPDGAKKAYKAKLSQQFYTN
jgi:hypothetical protein